MRDKRPNARKPINRRKNAKTAAKVEPQTISRFSTWRENLVLSFFVVVGLCLVVRAGFLQIFDTDYLKSQGDARYQRIKDSKPLRGMILDRNGSPLAISSPVDSIWAHPPTIKKLGSSYGYAKLAKLLGTTPSKFKKKMAKSAKREFVYLKRHLSPAEAENIMALEVPGVHKMREYRRYYPAGPVASHILGFTNIDNKGQEGIELVEDDQLKGFSGRSVIMQDRVGHVVEKLEQLKPVKHGDNIKLSIDARIQYLAYRHLKDMVKKSRAASASLVALDAKTGEVLAMVNMPEFNPNDRSDFQSSKFRNRAITDVFEPGSTVKPFTVAMALNEGVVNPDTIIATNGVFHIGRQTISDTKNHGDMTVSEVIKKSSNIGSTKIAAMMEPKRLVKTLGQLGFGQKTSIELRGEQAGVLPKRRRWRPIEHATLSYGYGTSTTTLQLAKAYTALANDEGKVLPVSIFPLKDGESPKGEKVFSKKTVSQMRSMLQSVVSQDGTAKRAMMSRYSAAGKTGTVHRAKKTGGYHDDSYVSLFAGFAPAKNPEIVMAVIVTDPRGEDYYGGRIAGPVFSSVMEGALRFRDVKPDLLMPSNKLSEQPALAQVVNTPTLNEVVQ